MLSHLDLFSGIGGFALAARRAGMQTIAFCEIDPYCRKVLNKHWPGVPCYEDVRTLDGTAYRGIDIITGGVPCQPASVAGKMRGSSDERWLWPEFLRVVREANPMWVLAENPLGIVSVKPDGLAWIVSELRGQGYETCVYQIGADDVGAPHRRKRIWVVGRLADAERGEGISGYDTNSIRRRPSEAEQIGLGGDETVGDAGSATRQRITRGFSSTKARERGTRQFDGHLSIGFESASPGDGAGHELADAERQGHQGAIAEGGTSAGRCAPEHGWPARPGEPQHEWEAPRLVTFPVGEPVTRVPDGVVSSIRQRTDWSDAQAEEWYCRNKVKLDRANNKYALKALGNAIVPQVAEVILRAIAEAEAA